MAKVAFLFPGQGSAAVGMGDAIASASAAARQVMHRFRALLPKVYAVCARGPTDQLIRTANAQPAIFAVDCACLAALDERNVRPDVVAGHSLGEYAALVAASVVDFETGLRLVIERASLMEKATAARPGKMLAVLGLGVGQVATIVGAWADRGVITNANDNAPGQICRDFRSDAVRRCPYPAHLESDSRRLSGCRNPQVGPTRPDHRQRSLAPIDRHDARRRRQHVRRGRTRQNPIWPGPALHARPKRSDPQR